MSTRRLAGSLSAFFALPLTLATTFAGGFATAGSVSAEPDDGVCAFRLSAPRVVQVSGVDMVHATVSPGACAVPANPNFSVVCLQKVGSDSASQCARAGGIDTAKVYYPYFPGSTYTATGTGCAATGNPPLQVCRSTGSSTATL